MPLLGAMFAPAIAEKLFAISIDVGEVPVPVVTPYPGDFRTADGVYAESEQLRRAGQAG